MTESRIVFTPYRPDHFAALRPQARQVAFTPDERSPDYAPALAQGGFTTTAIEQWPPVAGSPRRARILGIAGVLPQGAGRAVAWAILADRPGRHFLAMTRKARRGVELALDVFERIETYADAQWPESVLWVKALGFEPEYRAHRFAHGRDALVFARFSARPAGFSATTGKEDAA